MTMNSQKTIWWILLLLASGGTLLFAVVFATETRRWEFAADFYVLPLTNVPLSLVAALRLKHCYKVESLGAGFWHLSLGDIIALSLFIGICLAIFQCVLEGWFISIGIPYSLALGAAAALGILFAARKEYHLWKLRYLYALAFSTLIIGGLVSGGFVVVFLIIGFKEGSDGSIQLIGYLLEIRFSGGDQWIIYVWRIGLILLPVGGLALMLKEILRNQASQTTE